MKLSRQNELFLQRVARKLDPNFTDAALRSAIGETLDEHGRLIKLLTDDLAEAKKLVGQDVFETAKKLR